jgi:hypothetical protein
MYNDLILYVYSDIIRLFRQNLIPLIFLGSPEKNKYSTQGGQDHYNPPELL